MEHLYNLIKYIANCYKIVIGIFIQLIKYIANCYKIVIGIFIQLIKYIANYYKIVIGIFIQLNKIHCKLSLEYLYNLLKYIYKFYCKLL